MDWNGAVREERRQVAQSGAAQGAALQTWLNHDGLPDWSLVRRFPIRNRQGRVASVLSLFTDLPDSPTANAGPDLAAELRDRLADRNPVERMARDCGLSGRQFQRRFLKLYAQSPQKFLGESRVQQAMRLLVTTTLPMTGVARRCGFTNQSAFGSRFKSETGESPLRFRRKHRRSSIPVRDA